MNSNITGIGSFLNQFVIRLFSSNPQFFKIAQVLSLGLGLIAVVIDYVLLPASGFPISDQVHSILTTVQIITGTLLIAFRLPVKNPMPGELVTWWIENKTSQAVLSINNTWTLNGKQAIRFSSPQEAGLYAVENKIDNYAVTMATFEPVNEEEEKI